MNPSECAVHGLLVRYRDRQHGEDVAFRTAGGRKQNAATPPQAAHHAVSQRTRAGNAALCRQTLARDQSLQRGPRSGAQACADGRTLVQVELEDLLGVPVDLLTPAELPLKYRSRVLAEAKPV